jgi:hypothetical protein
MLVRGQETYGKARSFPRTGVVFVTGMRYTPNYLSFTSSTWIEYFGSM